MTEPLHQPALPRQVLEHLIPGYLENRPSGTYVDGTVGQGGHSALLLERLGPEGFLLGLDRDPAALESATRRLAPYAGRFRLVHARFSELEEVVRAAGIEWVDGVLLDTGLSRDQLLDPARGFSFDSRGFSMKMDPGEPGPDLAEIVNHYSVEQLQGIFSLLGRARDARRVARAIVASREGRRALASTADLAALIAATVGTPGDRGKQRHPATPWVMCLRIAVNNELEEIRRGLQAAVRVLRPGTGRLVVLTWAGHEHGLVRQTFRSLQQPCTCPRALPCICGKQPLIRVLTRQPVAPEEDEIHSNPAVRTCRLQAAVKL